MNEGIERTETKQDRINDAIGRLNEAVFGLEKLADRMVCPSPGDPKSIKEDVEPLFAEFIALLPENLDALTERITIAMGRIRESCF